MTYRLQGYPKSLAAKRIRRGKYQGWLAIALAGAMLFVLAFCLPQPSGAQSIDHDEYEMRGLK